MIAHNNTFEKINIENCCKAINIENCCKAINIENCCEAEITFTFFHKRPHWLHCYYGKTGKQL